MLNRSFEKFNQDMEKIGGLGDGTLTFPIMWCSSQGAGG